MNCPLLQEMVLSPLLLRLEIFCAMLTFAMSSKGKIKLNLPKSMATRCEMAKGNLTQSDLFGVKQEPPSLPSKIYPMKSSKSVLFSFLYQC